MKKFATAIPIAMLCLAPSLPLHASPWGATTASPSETQKPSSTTLGFLGRLVARSHVQSIEPVPPHTITSLTGSQPTQSSVQLKQAPEDNPTKTLDQAAVAPITATPEPEQESEKAPELNPASAHLSATQDEKKLDSGTISSASISNEPALPTTAEPQQVVASTDAPSQIEKQEERAPAPSKPSIFYRVFDAIIPAFTPELPTNTSDASVAASNEYKESLPLKELPVQAAKPEEATLVVHAATSEATTPAAQIFSLKANQPIHEQLQVWAKDAGWAFDWKLDTSWMPPVDTEFSGTFQSVAERIIDGLHSEGKQIKLIVWANNYAEVVDVSTR